MMPNVLRRYVPPVQRAKTLLEMAAALYDTSLSKEVYQPDRNTVHVESKVSSRIVIHFKQRPGQANSLGDLTFSEGGGFYEGLLAVARRDVSVALVNPSVALTMAYRGTGPFSEPVPVRPIAVFPSWDVVGFAVHRSTGITSLEQIRNEKVPLKLSTRQPLQPPFERDSTMYAVTQVLSSLGFSLNDILLWGGQIQSVISPSAKERLEGIINGTLNAIFDEGIEGGAAWGQTALDHGFQFLSLPDETLKRLSAMGYRRAILTPARFAGLGSEIQTVDFSGWPMVVHRDMPEEVAYALCEGLELRQTAIPADNDRPLDLAQLCRDDEEAPRDVPLHPGAERFYSERGYL